MTIEPRPPSGDRIAAEVEKELEDRSYPLRHVILVPAEHYVYLHPDDFAQVEGIVPRIVLDIQACLNTLVQVRNRRTIFSRLTQGLKSRPPIEMPKAGWTVYIRPDPNGKVDRGDLGITSRLAVPADVKFGSGAGTVRISHTIVRGTDRQTTHEFEPMPGSPTEDPTPPIAPQVAPVPPSPAAGGLTLPPRPKLETGPRLTFSDNTGRRVFRLVKDLTRIGRGGDAHSVDLEVVTGPEVSREHCRIRRASNGRFFLQDVSSWGTSVNGKAVPKFEENHIATEVELPDGAVVQLASAVTMRFDAR